MLKHTRGYGNTLGTLSSSSVKWQLIKTRYDELGGRLGTLIGLQADIMYGMCPSRRTHDDEAVPRRSGWVLGCVVAGGLFF